MTKKILSCPICGNNPVLWSVPERNQYGVQCYHNCIYVIPKCGHFSTKEEAIKAWNTRANSKEVK